MVSVRDVKNLLWNEADLKWKLHEGQRKIHGAVESSNVDEFLFLCARQFGKSYLSAVIAIEHCLRRPNSIVRIMSSTLKQVTDIVADNLTPLCEDAPHGLIEREKSSYRWRVGSSSLRLGAMERQYVDLNRGGNASLIICEEGGFLPSDDYAYAIRSVIAPQLLRSGGRLIHVTTPSEDPLHIVHTEIIPKTQTYKSFFKYTIYDNPQLTKEHIEKTAKLVGGINSPSFLREYMVEIIRDPSVMIVPEFDESRHVKDFKIPVNSNCLTAIDFGGVRDKTHGIFYTYDFQRDKVLIIDEFLNQPNTATDIIVSTCLGMESNYKESPVKARWADCQGQLMIDLQNTHKFSVRLPIKDDWQAGINNMQVMFAQDRIEIHPRCQFLRTSLKSGMYNKNRTDFARTETLGHCDALASLMYGLRMIDKSNPFDTVRNINYNYFTTNIKKDTDITAIAPKTFGASFDGKKKRLGSFKLDG